MTDPEKVEDLFSKVNEDISKIETKGNIVMYIVPFTYFFSIFKIKVLNIIEKR